VLLVLGSESHRVTPAYPQRHERLLGWLPQARGCWRAFSLVMMRSSMVVMLGVTELVLVVMVLVAGRDMGMGGSGGR